MNKIAIIATAGFLKWRKKDLIDNIDYWCNKRKIEYIFCTPQDTDALISEEILFAYCILIGVGSCLEDLINIDDRIPLVLDMATPPKLNSNIFINKRIAIRNAFAQSMSPLIPQLQVPMLPRPIKPLEEELLKDVVVFDTKQFHSADTHFYVASLLVHIAREWISLEKIVGHKLYFYLTSFMKLEVYLEMFDILVSKEEFHAVKGQELEILKDRLIPMAEKTSDYQDLLHRTRLFITEHGDIADTDLAQALCLGLPILTYKRFPFAQTSGIQHCAIKASRLLDPDIDKRVAFSNSIRIKEEWGLRRIIEVESVPKWDFNAFESMAIKTWDILLDWAQNGTVYNEMNKAMLGGYWNAGVVSEKIEYSILNGLKLSK